MDMRRITVGKIVKLVILCLIVGLILSFFGVGPADFWIWLGDLAKRSVDAVQRAASWAGPYILIGAAIVIPIAALRFLFARKKS